MQAAAADDEEVGVGRGGDERGHGLVGRSFVVVADDGCDEAFVDVLAAARDDRPELGAEARAELPGDGVCRGGLRRPVDADDDPARKVSGPRGV